MLLLLRREVFFMSLSVQRSLQGRERVLEMRISGFGGTLGGVWVIRYR